MTLGDLIEQVENDTDVTFQINCYVYDAWECYDEVWSYSPLLEPFKDKKITSLTAVKENVFKFTLEA